MKGMLQRNLEMRVDRQVTTVTAVTNASSKRRNAVNGVVKDGDGSRMKSKESEEANKQERHI